MNVIRISPEKAGIDAKHVYDFVNDIVNAGCCIHGMMLEKSGKCFFESYAPGYDSDTPHRMYSISKSFTSAAIGLLIDEGKLSLSDRIYKFFPEYPEEELHPYLKETVVRDLLTMQTPFDGTTYSPADKNWVSTFFKAVPSHKPGTIFRYDTSATLILDSIVERITGCHFEDYLFDKVLRHIGWEKAPKCIKAPEGVSWGGSGIICTLPQLMSFARLLMDGGRSRDGKQLISREYVAEATSFQVANETSNDFAAYKDRGYGYQIWLVGEGFGLVGMGNQLAVCCPKNDLIMCCIADDQGNSVGRENILSSLQRNILDRISDFSLPETGRTPDYPQFDYPLPGGKDTSPLQDEINGREYAFSPNSMGCSRMRFEFEGKRGRMIYETNRGTKTLTFSLGSFDLSVFPETHYFGDTIGTPSGKGYVCRSAGAWAEPHKLIIRTYITDEYLGNMTLTASFKDNTVNIFTEKTAEWFLDEYRGFACGVCEEAVGKEDRNG